MGPTVFNHFEVNGNVENARMTGTYTVTNLDRNRLKEKSKIKASDEKKVKKTLSLEKN